MRIVNRKTFLSLPEGILFSKFYDCDSFGPLLIKNDTMKWNEDDVGDFGYQNIADEVELPAGSECSDCIFVFEDSIKNGSSFNIDLCCGRRDGLFDADQLFAVWESKDLESLIETLTTRCRGAEFDVADEDAKCENADAEDFVAYITSMEHPSRTDPDGIMHEEVTFTPMARPAVNVEADVEATLVQLRQHVEQALAGYLSAPSHLTDDTIARVKSDLIASGALSQTIDVTYDEVNKSYHFTYLTSSSRNKTYDITVKRPVDMSDEAWNKLVQSLSNISNQDENDSEQLPPNNNDDELTQLCWLIQKQKAYDWTMGELLHNIRKYFTGLDSVKCVVHYKDWPETRKTNV